MNAKHFINNFLNPKSVALVGISRKTGRGAFNILENLIEFGYRGKIYPVNPNADEILGFKACQNVQSLPEGIDLAVIVTLRDIVPEIVDNCAARKIKGAIIISEGFGEADDKGKLLQRQIDDIVAKKGIRVLGPNSVGVVNSFNNFSSAFVLLPKYLTPVALISQSGGFFDGFAGCPFGKGIDLGNTSDINFIDAISYFEKDNDIRAIVLHMEGITNVSEFMRVCRQVARSKPIIVIKGGRSESGSKASASHTGSLSGSEALYSAMFRQSNIIQVDSISVIGDIVKAYLSLPPFKGKRAAVITPTGAAGIISLDSFEKYGFQPAVLSKKTIDRIAHLFQPWINVGNPVDILSAGMAHGYKYVYQTVLEACLQDKNIDIVLVVCGAYTLKTIKTMAANYPDKPVVAWILGADQFFISKQAEKYNFQAYYSSPNRALYALKVVREYYRQRDGMKET